MAGAGGLGLIEEHRHLASEVGPHDRSDEIDPADAVEGRSVGLGVIPVEVRVGTRAGRSGTGRPPGASLLATREPVLPVPPRTSVREAEVTMPLASGL